MLVKMLHTRMGSQDGFTVQQFQSGKYYFIADSLAAYFIRCGAARYQPVIDGCNNPEWYSTFYESSPEMQTVAQNIMASQAMLGDVMEAIG
jgi:hypothetical protein